MKKTRGLRQGTRHAFKKKPRDKITVNQFLQSFEKGDKVAIKIEPSSHHALPHRRFKGNVGIVSGMRGRAYIVKTKDMNKEKTLIVTAEHLRRL